MNISVRYMNIREFPLEDYLPSFPLVALGIKRKCAESILKPRRNLSDGKKNIENHDC